MNQLQDFKNGEKEPYPKPCPRCGGETYLTRSGQHIKWSCVDCGYIKFLPQKAENFHMPFGKFKGKSLEEISRIDAHYLAWACMNMDERIARRIREFLNAK